MEQQSQSKKLMVSILSLSLLTVMAGAAVAPALSVIQVYFADSDPFMVQMIVSVPAIFIVITNFFFSKLCKYFRTKTLVLIGLVLYILGGCLAGTCNNIVLVLLTRVFLGIGVGLIMPMSTGLLAYYFAPGQQEQLMGYSSAMNQIGGVIATLLSGLLANISWRASFLVYLMGLIGIVLCFLFLPNNRMEGTDTKTEKIKVKELVKNNIVYIGAMFLLMLTFFIYPTNFAMETTAEGLIPQQYIAGIMAGMDLVAFVGGMLFVQVKTVLGYNSRFAAPILFFSGYFLLAVVGGWFGTLVGSVCIGFANGVGIPFIISEASRRFGRAAAVTIMPLISAALYLAQFLCPFLMSIVTVLFGGLEHLPYWFGMILSGLFCVCSCKIR